MTGLATPIRRVAILGAGRVGTAIARTLVDAGYQVALAGAGHPESIELIVSFTTPGVSARWAQDAVADADLTVLALPLHKLPSVNAEMLGGRLVVDAMNYWPPVDGTIPAFEDAPRGTSAAVQDLLDLTRLVKTFNHTGYHDLEPDRREAGHPRRLGMAAAGDSRDDVALVAGVIERIGYDPIELRPLEAGRLLQPGTPLFGARLTAAQIREHVTSDARRAA